MQAPQQAGTSVFTGIFLVGFMGSGKSHWGKIWSACHNLPFYDLDEIIEKNEGMSINNIFEVRGEPYFRSSETETLHAMKPYKKFIVACGGGTPCFNNNMEWMNANGTTIFLDTSASTIASRLAKESTNRPLLKGLAQPELGLYIEKLILERKPFYHQARIIIPEEKINRQSLNSLLSKY